MNDELKIWIINASTLFVSFTTINNLFKLALLVVSIGYTATKWWYMIKKNPNMHKDEKNEDI